MISYPNQFIVTVQPTDFNSNDRYGTISRKAELLAAKLLKTRPALAMFYHIALNRTGYQFALSRTQICDFLGISKGTYISARDELVKHGFLSKTKGNQYNFYQVPEKYVNMSMADIRQHLCGDEMIIVTPDQKQEPDNELDVFAPVEEVSPTEKGVVDFKDIVGSLFAEKEQEAERRQTEIENRQRAERQALTDEYLTKYGHHDKAMMLLDDVKRNAKETGQNYHDTYMRSLTAIMKRLEGMRLRVG